MRLLSFLPYPNTESGGLRGGSFPLQSLCSSLFRIFPVVEHIVRPRMRACGVDRRIIRLKLVLAWSVPLLTSVGIKLCELFCNRVVPRDVSGELALCCCLSCGLLYLVLMLWVNVKLNALAEACPAKGAE